MASKLVVKQSTSESKSMWRRCYVCWSMRTRWRVQIIMMIFLTTSCYFVVFRLLQRIIQLWEGVYHYYYFTTINC